MPRARLLVGSRLRSAFVLVGAASALFGVALACGSTGTTDIAAPITGITVRAESLTSGRGCGTGSSQVFKYAVIVYARPSDDAGRRPEYDFVAANVYDCFGDATFVDLPDSRGRPFDLDVLAFNSSAFAASGAALTKAVPQLNANRALLAAEAGGADKRKNIADDLALLAGSNPTYSTTCTANQLGGVQSLAVCKPL